VSEDSDHSSRYDEIIVAVFERLVQVAYAEQEFAGLPVRPVGIKMVRDGSMFFVEFTATSDPLRIQSRFYKRYLLTRSAAG